MTYRAPVTEIEFALMKEAGFERLEIVANMKICQLIF